MSNRFRNIILLCGFLAIIYVPIIDQQLGITATLFPSSENRKLSTVPIFNFNQPQSYITNFDKYYQDNFGLRNLLFKAYSNYKIHFLQVSPLPDKVIVGKDGWLFLGNRWNKIIDQTSGSDIFSNIELDNIASTMDRRRKWLSEKGIKYYLAVAPNKHTLYREYLPNYLHSSPRTTKLKQLRSHLQNEIKFDVIDLKQDAILYKDSMILFNKTGTHWNDFGAFLGYTTLAKRIKQDFPNLHIFPISNFTIDTVQLKYRKGLSRMLNLQIKEKVIALTPKTEFNCRLDDDQLPVPTGFTRADDDYEMRYINTRSKNKLKILVFRDSFSTALVPYLAETFSESVFIWHFKFNKELIEKENPDIVIHEIVERSLDFLAK